MLTTHDDMIKDNYLNGAQMNEDQMNEAQMNGVQRNEVVIGCFIAGIVDMVYIVDTGCDLLKISVVASSCHRQLSQML